MDNMIFDEVYHGRTAYEFLHGLSIYETTHPPLGKIIISLGIAAFGMNPFGFRIMALLFGTMMISLIGHFAFALTGRAKYTLLAAVLLSTEFMHFTLSRIATVDIFVAFFILGMFCGMFLFVKNGSRRGLVLSGICTALGIATKWTAVYAAAGIALLWLAWFIHELKRDKEEGIKAALRRLLPHILTCIVLFVFLPVMVYILSYIPFARVNPGKSLIACAVDNSRSALKYHENVTAEHPYQSPWYSWLINWRPLLDSYDKVGDKVSTVATFVNPFTSMFGLVSIVHHVYLAVRRKSRTAIALLLFYAAMLVPWMFISRTVFIYQYFSCTQILILMICNSIRYLDKAKQNKAILAAGAISTGLFILYYPVLSGTPITRSFLTTVLEFMPKWTL